MVLLIEPLAIIYVFIPVGFMRLQFVCVSTFLRNGHAFLLKNLKSKGLCLSTAVYVMNLGNVIAYQQW